MAHSRLVLMAQEQVRLIFRALRVMARSIVIIGASKGIGRATAEAFRFCSIERTRSSLWAKLRERRIVSTDSTQVSSSEACSCLNLWHTIDVYSGASTAAA